MLTLDDIIKAKEILDKQKVPSDGRVVKMSREAYLNLLEKTKLKGFDKVCGFQLEIY